MKNTNNTNTNTRTTTIIREELESYCGKYTASRIKHDNAIENGKSVTAKQLKELAEINKKCEELVAEYKTASREEFYQKCSASENPVKSALVIYEYETVSIIDEAVSKENPTFAKRSIVSKTAVVDIFDFEKYIGIDKDAIATQRGWVNKLGRELTLRVSRALGCEKGVKSDIADEIKSASNLEFNKAGKKSDLLVALQSVVDAIYCEIDEKTNANIIVCDKTDEAYLEYCFTRKGKERLSIKVLRDGSLVYVITDMIHKAFTNEVYTVTGYRTK